MHGSSNCAVQNGELAFILHRNRVRRRIFRAIQDPEWRQTRKAGNDGFKKARILANSLPTSVVTDIQRRIKPKLLTETSFEELERQLTSCYSIKKSVT